MEAFWAGAHFRNNSDSMPPFPGQRWLQMTQPQEGLGCLLSRSDGLDPVTLKPSLSHLGDMSEKSWPGLRVQTVTLNGTAWFWKRKGTAHELNLLHKHPHCQLSQEMPDDKTATLPLLGVRAVYYTSYIHNKQNWPAGGTQGTECPRHSYRPKINGNWELSDPQPHSVL